MNHFTLLLRDTRQFRQIERLTSFVGEDASGSFGIQAGRHRLMTSLIFGLARFRGESGDWQYLALPGALLLFEHNRLLLNTRRYYLSDDIEQITQVLQHTLAREERALAEMKLNLERLEEGVMQRLREMGKTPPPWE